MEITHECMDAEFIWWKP